MSESIRKLIAKAEALADAIDTSYEGLFLSIRAMNQNGEVDSLRSSITNLEKMKKGMEECILNLAGNGLVELPNDRKIDHLIQVAERKGYSRDRIFAISQVERLPCPSWLKRYTPTVPLSADAVRKAEQALYMLHRLIKHAKKGLRRAGETI